MAPPSEIAVAPKAAVPVAAAVAEAAEVDDANPAVAPEAGVADAVF